VLFANYGEVFIQVVRRSSYPSWNNDPCSAELGQLFSPHDDPSLEFYGRKPYRGTRIFYSDRMGNWNRNWPSFSPWHRDACALLREALRTESDGRAQVALSSALEAAQDKESQELRGIIAVTHLVDDSISWNADCSSSYLSALGEEAILYVTAGLKAGVKIDDWQLVVLANNILYQIDPYHNPANWSYVNEFLWEQMKDDEIDGNATGAIHYFQRWGPDSIPFLMSHENHDQQRQRAVERIVREVERDE